MRFRDILLEYDRQVSMARWAERLRGRLLADKSLSPPRQDWFNSIDAIVNEKIEEEQKAMDRARGSDWD